ncbi:MAG TPA: hypothetical protein VLZ89_16705 [Anaerolineales bacterium]|nr:hypothetical protein [Anaerolineales bacterium]
MKSILPKIPPPSHLPALIHGAIERFVREEKGQDFAEYALILGAIGIVALAVILRYRTALIDAFNSGIAALQASH